MDLIAKDNTKPGVQRLAPDEVFKRSSAMKKRINEFLFEVVSRDTKVGDLDAVANAMLDFFYIEWEN